MLDKAKATGWLIVFVSCLVPRLGATRRPPTPLDSLIRNSAGAAIVVVEELRSVQGVKVAVARVSRTLMGLEGEKRLGFLAQSFRSSQSYSAVAGQRLLLFVSKAPLKQQRHYLRLTAAFRKAVGGTIKLYLIAGGGDGSLPIRLEQGGAQVELGRLPPQKGLPYLDTTRRSVRLDELERYIRAHAAPTVWQQACLPVYLRGGCPVGCARVDIPAGGGKEEVITACGFRHRLVRRGTTPFLVPLPPRGTRYAGRICSAQMPSPATCRGRCQKACEVRDIRQHFRPLD